MLSDHFLPEHEEEENEVGEHPDNNTHIGKRGRESNLKDIGDKERKVKGGVMVFTTFKQCWNDSLITLATDKQSTNSLFESFIKYML